eukprot:1749337-Rhodomonas_salina.1
MQSCFNYSICYKVTGHIWQRGAFSRLLVAEAGLKWNCTTKLRFVPDSEIERAAFPSSRFCKVLYFAHDTTTSGTTSTTRSTFRVVRRSGKHRVLAVGTSLGINTRVPGYLPGTLSRYGTIVPGREARLGFHGTRGTRGTSIYDRDFCWCLTYLSNLTMQELVADRTQFAVLHLHVFHSDMH